MKKIFFFILVNLLFMHGFLFLNAENYILFTQGTNDTPVNYYFGDLGADFEQIKESCVLLDGPVKTDKFKIGTPYEIIYPFSERNSIASIRENNKIEKLKLPGEIKNCVKFYKIDFIPDYGPEYLAIYKQQFVGVGNVVNYEIYHKVDNILKPAVKFFTYAGSDYPDSSKTFLRIMNMDNDKEIEIETITISETMVNDKSYSYKIETVRYDWDGQKYTSKIMDKLDFTNSNFFFR